MNPLKSASAILKGDVKQAYLKVLKHDLSKRVIRLYHLIVEEKAVPNKEILHEAEDPPCLIWLQVDEDAFGEDQYWRLRIHT
jgi:hypothetical protein